MAKKNYKKLKGTVGIYQNEITKHYLAEKRIKGKTHNADNPKYRATIGMLRKVFERGVGAYRTNPGSVRGNVTSADQWAMARVNAFLKALKTGKFPRSPFDTDLLPDNHPNASDEKYRKPKKSRHQK